MSALPLWGQTSLEPSFDLGCVTLTLKVARVCLSSGKSRGPDGRGLMEFKAIHLYQSSHMTRAPNTAITVAATVTKSYLTLCDPTDCSTSGSFCPWDFPGKNIGVSYHFFLQGFFPTQGSNPYPLHWQVDSLPLSHHGSPSQDQSIIILFMHYLYKSTHLNINDIIYKVYIICKTYMYIIYIYIWL